jgi:LytS/YehU family sensor histidine kinase
MRITIFHILLFWLLFAFFMTGVMMLVHPITNRPVSLYAEFVWEGGFAAAWILGTPVSLWLARRFRVTAARPMKNSIILFITGLILSVLLCLLHGLILFLFHPEVKVFETNVLLTSLFYNIDKMLIVFVGLVIMQHAMEYYRQAQERELTASRLETQLSQAQMMALKMQLQPHFLFNTLNAIVTLVRKDPDQAEEMIVRLSDFLRLTLDASGKQLVTLKEELEFIKAYLSIEEVRFGGRLQYRDDIPSELLDAEVPMLLLQPLVENSVRHGFSRYEDASLLQISARLQGNILTVTVTDDAAPLEAMNTVPEGIGLANTRSRLRTLYGESAGLTVTPVNPRGVSVELTLPYSPIQP